MTGNAHSFCDRHAPGAGLPAGPGSSRNSQSAGGRLWGRWSASAASLLAVAALVAGPAPQPADPTTTFFMGRVKYSQNDGNDCRAVGKELMQLVSRVSSLKVQEEKRIRLTDPELFETPFLFMNGHNDFTFTQEEVEALRLYLEHGGFLFASGCCTNPKFPEACRREFARIFPGESVETLPYDHQIYRAFYSITRIRSLHENKDIHLEGLFFRGRMVVVLCEDGLCCAFSMANRCNQGKGVSPEDGQRLALNIAVYALTH